MKYLRSKMLFPQKLENKRASRRVRAMATIGS